MARNQPPNALPISKARTAYFLQIVGQIILQTLRNHGGNRKRQAIKDTMSTKKKKSIRKDKAYKKLSTLIDCKSPANLLLCELFEKHSPFQLFETLLFHNSNIPLEDASKRMLTAHYSIAQLSFSLLQLHCHLCGWKTQHNSSFSEVISSLYHNHDELENYRDLELFIKFLNLQGERTPSIVYHQLYDLKNTFLKLAALERGWNINSLGPIL